LAFYDTLNTAATLVFTGGNIINSLQMVTGSNILWARDTTLDLAGQQTLQSFTELLLQAVPTLSYPVNNAIIPVNSLNGVVNAFNFTWAAPAVTLPVGATYAVSLFYNAALTMPVGAAAGIAVTNMTIPVAWLGALTPGTTYYWNVQITAPIHSFASATGSFTVQQLAAIVPTLSSPVAGAILETLQPAFSWNPISGATGYQFQLSKEPSFVVLVFTENVTTAGEMLPVAMKLTDGEQYYWRVRVVTPSAGDWSEVGNFSIAIPVIPTFTPTTTIVLPTPQITLPQPTVTVVLPTTSAAPVEKISPAYIWAIIIIGAVLVIAVIVLIVRTRRTV
jgi:hypothetical protein